MLNVLRKETVVHFIGCLWPKLQEERNRGLSVELLDALEDVTNQVCSYRGYASVAWASGPTHSEASWLGRLSELTNSSRSLGAHDYVCTFDFGVRQAHDAETADAHVWACAVSTGTEAPTALPILGEPVTHAYVCLKPALPRAGKRLIIPYDSYEDAAGRREQDS